MRSISLLPLPPSVFLPGRYQAVLTCSDSLTAHIFDYSTEIEEREKMNANYLGHANRTSPLVSSHAKP